MDLKVRPPVLQYVWETSCTSALDILAEFDSPMQSTAPSDSRPQYAYTTSDARKAAWTCVDVANSMDKSDPFYRPVNALHSLGLISSIHRPHIDRHFTACSVFWRQNANVKPFIDSILDKSFRYIFPAGLPAERIRDHLRHPDDRVEVPFETYCRMRSDYVVLDLLMCPNILSEHVSKGPNIDVNFDRYFIVEAKLLHLHSELKSAIRACIAEIWNSGPNSEMGAAANITLWCIGIATILRMSISPLRGFFEFDKRVRYINIGEEAGWISDEYIASLANSAIQMKFDIGLPQLPKDDLWRTICTEVDTLNRRGRRHT